jgi:hypothetical protein
VLLVDREREPELDDLRGDRRDEAADPISRPVIIAAVPDDRRRSGRR